jgi:putative methanogenesis marker protein 3
MKVRVNDVEIELPEGSTVKDAIEKSGAFYHKGSVIALIKDISKVAEETDHYLIETTKGNLKLKLYPTKFAEYWKRNYRQYEGKPLVWKARDVLAFGHVTSDFTPQRTPQNYKRWDVFFGLSGFESDKTDIMFSTSDHTGIYGEPEGGVFAKLVGGRNILSKLAVDDCITSITPVVEGQRQTASEPIAPETRLSGGEQIVTYLEVDLTEGPHDTVEYALAALENHAALVDNTAHAFIQLKGIRDLIIEQENNQAHRRGTLTVRNRGVNTGELYIYKEHRLPTNSHNVVGKVTYGIELADVAAENQTITIKTVPERIMVLGLTQKQAEEVLAQRGVTQQREGLTDDDAIVVKQEPINTLKILETRTLTTLGVPPEEVVKIELYYDKAPETIQYFKFMCGLLEKPIGNMRVFYNHQKLGMTLFKPNVRLFNRAIVRENTPCEKIEAFEIGITNMSRKNLGMIGVRSKADASHGPTGEEFTATNIIGRIVDGFDLVTKSKADQMIYLQVINKPEL